MNIFECARVPTCHVCNVGSIKRKEPEDGGVTQGGAKTARSSSSSFSSSASSSASASLATTSATMLPFGSIYENDSLWKPLNPERRRLMASASNERLNPEQPVRCKGCHHPMPKNANTSNYNYHIKRCPKGIWNFSISPFDDWMA